MIDAVLSRTAGRFDRVAKSLLFAHPKRRPSPADRMDHDDRIRALEAIRHIYEPALVDPSTFYATPPSTHVEARHVRRELHASERVEVLDLSWPSVPAPYCSDVAERLAVYQRNARGAARLFLHPRQPSVTAILVHGYRGGQYALEERFWPVEWLLRHGISAALFVLPLHGVRAPDGPPRFPSSDPRITNECLRQAIFDLRVLIDHVKGRGSRAGVLGMSLGGYTISLLASVVPDLEFAVPIIPFASFARAARDTGRLVGDAAEQRLQSDALDAVHRIVSPLHRPTLVTRERLLVLAAAGDELTPIEGHARPLAEHLGAPLFEFPGGHILQFGRRAAFRRVGQLFDELGLRRR